MKFFLERVETLGKALGEGSFGEVVQAELKEHAKEHYKYKEQFFAVKRLSISFLNKEQMIKERTGMDSKS